MLKSAASFDLSPTCSYLLQCFPYSMMDRNVVALPTSHDAVLCLFPDAAVFQAAAAALEDSGEDEEGPQRPPRLPRPPPSRNVFSSIRPQGWQYRSQTKLGQSRSADKSEVLTALNFLQKLIRRSPSNVNIAFPSGSRLLPRLY